DEIRSMFPYTALITPEGFALEDGKWVSLEEFANLPAPQRDYYVKYSGSDLALNWGSKGVYHARTLSKPQTAKLFEEIAGGFRTGRFWTIQKSHLSEGETVRYISREGGEVESAAHSKFSAFYGPDGLMGILLMQRPFHKVHGSPSTIFNICT
ncbi:MAG: hypothetical protein ACLGPL_05825, partial [Acidobacteriota bacterium]